MPSTEGTSLISGKKIATIFNGCLFKRDELYSFPSEKKKHPKEYIPTYGTNSDVGFHPERVQAYKDQIIDLLDELPDTFKEKGGGAPLQCAMYDRHGTQWTFLRGVIEQLLHLGQAVGKIMRRIPPNPAVSSDKVLYVVLNDCQEVEVKRVVNQ